MKTEIIIIFTEGNTRSLNIEYENEIDLVILKTRLLICTNIRDVRY